LTTTTDDGIARCVLHSVTDREIVLAVPGSEYRLHLVPTVPASAIATEPGKRIRGRIEARALRMHGTTGGGRFIEPVWGAPRIVAGAVRSIDEASGCVLIDPAVPVWVSPPDDQDRSVIRVGDLANFYVESGATFTPVEG
jgi:hypothetical protein